MIVRETPETLYEAITHCIDTLTLMRQRGTCYGTGIGSVVANVTNKLVVISGNLTVDEASRTMRSLDIIEAEHLENEKKHAAIGGSTYNGGIT